MTFCCLPFYQGSTQNDVSSSDLGWVLWFTEGNTGPAAAAVREIELPRGHISQHFTERDAWCSWPETGLHVPPCVCKGRDYCSCCRRWHQLPPPNPSQAPELHPSKTCTKNAIARSPFLSDINIMSQVLVPFCFPVPQSVPSLAPTESQKHCGSFLTKVHAI